MRKLAPELEEICTCNNLDHSDLNYYCPVNGNVNEEWVYYGPAKRPEDCTTKVTEIKLKFVTHTYNSEYESYYAKKLIEGFARYITSIETYWLDENE